MAQIHNFTNFTGTINGLVYYMANGRQFVRADAKKRTGTISKVSLKKMLPGIEAVHTMKAIHSMNHLVNALKNEFDALQTAGGPEKKSIGIASGKSLSLVNAVREHNEIKFMVRGTEIGLYLIILQINFKTGTFRRKKMSLAEAHCIRKNTYTVETEYQARKGYTDLLFIYGHHFLKAVTIQEKRNRNH